ncbi:hypothetical protein JB92DRAFT_3040258 [Gautieria morchelliformis]|nr:hypothetical protein JB92DRAFT_3040258 [Gautieria morchelliformis]
MTVACMTLTQLTIVLVLIFVVHALLTDIPVNRQSPGCSAGRHNRGVEGGRRGRKSPGVQRGFKKGFRKPSASSVKGNSGDKGCAHPPYLY